MAKRKSGPLGLDRYVYDFDDKPAYVRDMIVELGHKGKLIVKRHWYRTHGDGYLYSCITGDIEKDISQSLLEAYIGEKGKWIRKYSLYHADKPNLSYDINAYVYNKCLELLGQNPTEDFITKG